MSLQFAYRQFIVRRPLLTLGGQMARPRPVIDVTIIGPAGTSIMLGLLDTGADDTVFPDWVAGRIGIDLAQAPVVSSVGVGGVPSLLHVAQVALRIADNKERREWTTQVGFTSAAMRHPLLGYAGFLQFFDATFFGERQVVELTVNSSYPGT